MIAWRVIKTRYAMTPLSAAGALLVAGRWNEAGTPVIYTSSSLALAALEVFVHLQPEQRHTRHTAFRIEIPDAAPITHWGEGDLPEGWRETGAYHGRVRGTQWARQCSALALVVPSAIIPSERNIVLNTAHPAFRDVHAEDRGPFAFDERMWKEQT